MQCCGADKHNIWCSSEEKYVYSERNLRTHTGVVKERKCRYSELWKQGDLVMSALGEKIRKLRKAKGYTLEKLADLSKSSKSYIWELENKNPPRPSGEKLAKIASELGVTSEFLLDTTESVDEKDAADEAFYRKFRKMDSTTKNRIRRLVDLWDEE